MAATGAATIHAERVRLDSSLTLIHSYAPSNPSVVVRAMVRAGASREDARQAGLASLVGRMLRQGSQGIGKVALAEELDGMGAGLSVDVGYTTATATLKCLADDLPRSLELLAEVLTRPSFAPDELERLRGQVLTELSELEDDTRNVANQTWRTLAYPPNHPYHRHPLGTAETLPALGRDDVSAFHGRWYHPSQATLVVVGSVDLESAVALAERIFGSWESADDAPVADSLPDTPLLEAATRAAPLVGKAQADIVLGLPTLHRAHPEYHALLFANHVLGRMYFMGRLGEKVRDDLGLAYYVYSDLSAGFGRGPWVVRAGVNPANLQRALASIRGEVDRFLNEGPSVEEHADAVSSLVGSLPRQLELNEGMAAHLAEVELYGLGLDYLERYQAEIRSLDAATVRDTAHRWLRPEQMHTAIAGPIEA